MKKYLLAILVALLAGTSAKASILTLYMLDSYSDMLSPQPVEYWSGAYGGVHISGVWSGFDGSAVTASNAGGSGTFSAGQLGAGGPALGGGVDIGYNVTSSGAVVGVEGDLSYNHFTNSSKAFAAASVISGGDSLTGTLSSGQDFSMTLRGRVGLLLTPETLLYATGGFAVANAKATIHYVYNDGGPAVAGTASDDTLATGWVVGAGIEDNFIDNASAKIEYLYTYFPSTKFTMSDSGMTYRFSGAIATQQLRFGLNFKF